VFLDSLVSCSLTDNFRVTVLQRIGEKIIRAIPCCNTLCDVLVHEYYCPSHHSWELTVLVHELFEHPFYLAVVKMLSYTSSQWHMVEMFVNAGREWTSRLYSVQAACCRAVGHSLFCRRHWCSWVTWPAISIESIKTMYSHWGLYVSMHLHLEY